MTANACRTAVDELRTVGVDVGVLRGMSLQKLPKVEGDRAGSTDESACRNHKTSDLAFVQS